MIGLLGLLGREATAGACAPYSSQERSRVLGVGPDGTFVVASVSDHEASTGTKQTSLSVHAPGGARLASIRLEASDDERLWQLEGDDPDTRRALGSLLAMQDLNRIEAALRERYRLTPLRPSALSSSVSPLAPDCHWMRVDTPAGARPVLAFEELAYHDGSCLTGLATSLLEHPASPLIFARVIYAVPLQSSGDHEVIRDADEVQWFPASRLAAAAGEEPAAAPAPVDARPTAVAAAAGGASARPPGWLDPGAALLGVLAAASFSLGYRRGFRARR